MAIDTELRTQPDDGSALKASAFTGRDVFRQHIRDILALAVVQQWPAMILSDPDFADWPLGEKAVVQSLQDWSKNGRSITLLASNFGIVQAHHARLVTWRRRWDAIVSCRRLVDKNGSDGLFVVPSAVWTPDWTIHRTSLEQTVGICTQSAFQRAEVRQVLDNCVKQSTAGFSASVVGL